MFVKVVQRNDGKKQLVDAPGIRVIPPETLARLLERCRRRLPELESRGQLPRRRRIGKRLTGYYEHELLRRYAADVVVRDPRTLSREQLAAKLAVHRRTVTRMVRRGELPPPVDGRWYEREIDAWLLERPQV